MKIELTGHTEKYLCETLCLLFFPGSRFEAAGEDGRIVRSVLTLKNKTAVCETALTDGERTAVSRSSEPLRQDGRYSPLIARSFYKAGVELTGHRPPWGTLTGIRPSKLVRELLSAGCGEDGLSERLSREYYVRSTKTALALSCAKAEIEAAGALPDRSASLYISIPFCPSRCSYCSFVSHTVERAKKLLPDYVELLCRELGELGRSARENNLNVISAYVGGGTPSILSPEQLRQVMGAVENAFGKNSFSEYTVEAGRPDTITPEKLLVIREFGAGRVSINPQTMDEEVLRRIGRRHSPEETLTAFKMAREAGFPVINMDLIAGLPGDTPEGFRRSLAAVRSLGPENITVHTLSVKRSARIKEEDPDVLRQQADSIGRMVEHSRRSLTDAGYRPYYLYRQKNTAGNHENVGWCLPGTEGLYNLCMMGELHTVLGAGAGAVTKLVSADCGRIERVFNTKYPYEYIRDAEKCLTTTEKIKEFYGASYQTEGTDE